jgi:hypothetical protein
MFVELVYDKRNFDGLPGARDIILGELSKRVHRIFPDADVRVKPMMTLPAINTDASKHERSRSAGSCRRCLKKLICGLKLSLHSMVSNTSRQSFDDMPAC